MRSVPFVIFLALSAGCGAQTAAKTGPEKPAAAEPKETATPADAGGEAAGPPPVILGAKGEIPLSTLAGEDVELRDYGARVTVIATWAVWCAPCLEELPYLEKLHQKYAEREDVSVIAVNIDPEEKRDRVLELAGEHDLTMPMLLEGKELFERLVEDGRRGLPLLAIISPEFDIHRITGFRAGLSHEEYVSAKSAIIEAVLAGEKPPELHAASTGRPPPGATIKMKLPAIEEGDDEKVASTVELMRKSFANSFPELSGEEIEDLVSQIEAALRRGDTEVELQL